MIFAGFERPTSGYSSHITQVMNVWLADTVVFECHEDDFQSLVLVLIALVLLEELFC